MWCSHHTCHHPLEELAQVWATSQQGKKVEKNLDPLIFLAIFPTYCLSIYMAISEFIKKIKNPQNLVTLAKVLIIFPQKSFAWIP